MVIRRSVDSTTRRFPTARAAGEVLSSTPEVGVPHDGREVCAVLDRLASGNPAPGA